MSIKGYQFSVSGDDYIQTAIMSSHRRLLKMKGEIDVTVRRLFGLGAHLINESSLDDILKAYNEIKGFRMDSTSVDPIARYKAVEVHRRTMHVVDFSRAKIAQAYGIELKLTHMLIIGVILAQDIDDKRFQKLAHVSEKWEAAESHLPKLSKSSRQALNQI